MKPSKMKMCVLYKVTSSNVVSTCDAPKIAEGDFIYYVDANTLRIDHHANDKHKKQEHFLIQKFQIEEPNNISDFEVEVSQNDPPFFLTFSDDEIFYDTYHTVRVTSTKTNYKFEISTDNFYGLQTHFKPYEKVYYIKDKENSWRNEWGFGEIKYILFDGGIFKYVVEKEDGELDVFEHTKNQLKRNLYSGITILY